ncbi:EamA family transporter RarD [Bacillus sp. LJBS17]|uniref:EamA family transporter RarD n=1 Tax=Bacillus sp. LJBS17 TaxID=2859227 RepID=UPI001C56B23D|nr:EamA family transporter RarD [Bacillus sp. LJBS17]QXW84018.1 EamA family transporter RarD [Bacillus sp. LJBS17]
MIEEKDRTFGIIYGIIAYTIWGLSPLYWNLLDSVLPFKILVHRIFWGLIFLLIVLLITKKIRLFLTNIKLLLLNPKLLALVIISSLLVSANWLLNIWSVNNGYVIENSLGYYINPLVSILLGTIFLKEKLNFWQVLSILLATIGVIISTIDYGKFPYIALSIALSFGLYGLLKKSSTFDVLLAQTFEMVLIVPFAIIYLLKLQLNGATSFGSQSAITTILLIGTGIITIIPQLLHVNAVKRITLTLSGFIQYIIPTLTLILGIFVFREAFSFLQFISFSFIWIGVLLFSFSNFPFMQRLSPLSKKDLNLM